jgi:alpha-N-arabinofuranosidase
MRRLAMKKYVICKIQLLIYLLLLYSCSTKTPVEIISVYPDSVLSDVSNHPVGINLDYFMDGDRYPDPDRSLTKALREMGVRYLRYPGGDKSDLNLFSSPPYEEAKPLLARTGKGAVDDYTSILRDYKEFKYDVLDFDEFMEMCIDLEVEPVVVVPADSYLKNYPPGCTYTDRATLINHAAEWVRYANIKKRYKVKYWMIGNECWHSYNSNSNAEIYARDVVDFSKTMKAVDPTIAIIPNGNSFDYFSTLLKIAGDYIDYLCLSNYPVYNYLAGYLTYRDTIQNLMSPVNEAIQAIKIQATEEQKKRIKLIISEYGPFDRADKWPQINDMGHNLVNFEMTGEQLIRPEIEFSCFWNTRWIDNDSIENSAFDALDKNGNFNANGYGLMIWGRFMGDKMIKSTSSLHLRTYSSYTPKEGKLFIYLINKSNSVKSVRINIGSRRIQTLIQAWELYGQDSDDCKPIWQELQLWDALNNIHIKGTSITVIECIIK